MFAEFQTMAREAMAVLKDIRELLREIRDQARERTHG